MNLDYFQLIDRIVELNLDEKKITVEAQVPAAHTIFEGHFPGFPIMPGVLLTEAMAQSSGWLLLGILKFERMPFLAIVKEDLSVLRHFRGESSLATYLTVIARRVVVRKLVEGHTTVPLGDMVARAEADEEEPEARINDREEVGRLLGQLQGSEAAVVRMYHLEGKTYQEISSTVGMPENSVGPMLSRARAKLRRRAGV